MSHTVMDYAVTVSWFMDCVVTHFGQSIHVLFLHIKYEKKNKVRAKLKNANN